MSLSWLIGQQADEQLIYGVGNEVLVFVCLTSFIVTLITITCAWRYAYQISLIQSEFN